MSEGPEFKISQDYEIVPLQKKRAYLILVEEWEYLKSKIRQVHDNANLYHTIGSVLLGISGSALVAALTLRVPSDIEVRIAIETQVAWLIFIATLICGCLSLYFGKSQRKIQNANTEDIINHMRLIEKRYESET